ncbi:hypothetical protein EVAR_50607_1 [Eumeta japonica]|uniref:Secreted protein n=1 Tax=Eumeta variegata TaxID=151549 RepID=A0A4C1YAJ7_EUMVA|nr:hypothetical protein EVAR_50607_1 [Eumeta japonica]
MLSSRWWSLAVLISHWDCLESSSPSPSVRHKKVVKERLSSGVIKTHTSFGALEKNDESEIRCAHTDIQINSTKFARIAISKSTSKLRAPLRLPTDNQGLFPTFMGRNDGGRRLPRPCALHRALIEQMQKLFFVGSSPRNSADLSAADGWRDGLAHCRRRERRASPTVSKEPSIETPRPIVSLRCRIT